MNDFLNIEGKYYKMATNLGDIVLVGILWTIFSLPMITIGATTTALYYVCTKKNSGRDEYIFKGFLRSFKKDFAKSSSIFALLVFVFFMVWLNINLLPTMNWGELSIVVYVALYFMLIQAIFVTMYVFPLVSRFELSVLGALKSAFFMSNKHLIVTFTNLALLIALVYASIFLPFLIILTMGFYIYLSSFLFVKVFRKHHLNFDEPTHTDANASDLSDIKSH